MSWAVGYDAAWSRDIGYGVPATCDHPGCGARIDRGLTHVCGGDVRGGEHGCGLYFCSDHLYLDDGARQQCDRCSEGQHPFAPTPDVEEWTRHKATDPSWAKWRAENGIPEPGPVASPKLAEHRVDGGRPVTGERDIRALIEASSLGAPDVVAARGRVSDEEVAAVMRRYNELGAADPGVFVLPESWFGEPAPSGVRIIELDDDVWVAWGHVTVVEFQAAHLHWARLFYDNATPIPEESIRQVWAVMEPSWPGAPDDEWTLRLDATWATPGAVRVTIGREDPPSPDLGITSRLRIVRPSGDPG